MCFWDGESGGICPLPTGPRLVRSGSIKRISSCPAVPPIRGRNNRQHGGVQSSEVTQSCWFPDQTAADYHFKTEVRAQYTNRLGDQNEFIQICLLLSASKLSNEIHFWHFLFAAKSQLDAALFRMHCLNWGCIYVLHFALCTPNFLSDIVQLYTIDTQCGSFFISWLSEILTLFSLFHFILTPLPPQWLHFYTHFIWKHSGTYNSTSAIDWCQVYYYDGAIEVL